MYDLIIIGAGSAGISAYKQASKQSQNILIINAGSWDTTCARVGCMPSKVLISTANRFYDATHADEVGLDLNVEFNHKNVMSHVRALRDSYTQSTLDDVLSWPKEHRVSGQAHFKNKNTVVVNGQEYQAKSFILAVGSTPNIEEEWKDILKERLITSDQVFELETVPESLAVIGSGAIALELAQAFTRLGVKTKIFARSKRIGSLSSPKLQKLAQDELSQSLDVLFETLPTQVKRVQQKAELTFEVNNETQTEQFDYVLSATGRNSLLSTLKLENIDKSFNDVKTLPIDKHSKQLADLPIFVAGDAFTSTPIQHEATHEGRQLVHSCLNYPDIIKNVKTLVPLSIVFSSPEMAIIGQSHQELTKQKTDFVTGFVSYEDQGRAKLLGKNQGAVEVYIDKTSRKLLGAEFFVESAEHMALLLNWMIGQDIDLDRLLEQPYYHPTLEEGLRTAFNHAKRQLK